MSSDLWTHSDLQAQLEGLRECDHLGLLYQDGVEQMNASVPFFRAGLAKRERCAYVSTAGEPGDAARRLWAALGDEVVVVTTSADDSTAGSTVGALRRLAAETFSGSAGYAGLRVAVAPGAGFTPEQVLQWEVHLCAFLIQGCRIVALCLYDRRRLPPASVRAVLRSHPLVLLEDQLCPNPYHEPLDVVGVDHTGERRAEWMISRLRAGAAREEGAGTRLAREQRARLEAEAAEHRAAFLAEASIVLSSSLDLETTLDRVARLAVPTLADWCLVDVIGEDQIVRRVAAAHADDEKLRMAADFWRRYPIDLASSHPIAEVMRSGRSLVVPEISDALLAAVAKDAEHLQFLRGLGLGSWALVPLVARGRTLGAITFATALSDRRYETPSDLAFAEALSRRAALAMDNARLFAESERRRREAECLADLALLITESLDPAEVSQRIADSLRTLLRARSAVLLRIEQPSGDLRAVAASGEVGLAYGPGAVFPREIGAPGLATRERRPAVTPDLLADPRLTFTDEVRARVARDPWRAVLAVPLTVKGREIGILRVGDVTGRRFSDNEVLLAQTFAHQAAIAQENSRLYAEAEATAVERERVRMAAALHDTLSQVLFSIGLKLDWCLRHLMARSELRTKIEEIQRGTGFVMEQIRRLISQLSPEDDPGEGLGARLERIAREFRDLTGIVVELAIAGDPGDLSAQQREVFQKAVREGLTNVAKHARATRATLRVLVRDDLVEFELSDDGIGLAAARVTKEAKHFGLRLMRERIESVGGRLEQGPSDSGGCRLRGTLPRR
jgi:signal transduction histidine kinase